jgi:hypothetical protein
MKLYFWILIIIVSITGVVCTLTYFQGIANKQNSDVPPIEVYYFNELYKATITNESLELNNPLIYIGNDTTKKMSLFDIVSGKCLVFRFSGEACNVCIDFVINKLKNKFSDFAENDRILLIGSNINNRVKEKYYGKRIITFCSENLNLPFEEYNTPFLFIIDRDRICKMMFVPEKGLPEFTDMYLINIKDRYFPNQGK